MSVTAFAPSSAQPREAQQHQRPSGRFGDGGGRTSSGRDVEDELVAYGGRIARHINGDSCWRQQLEPIVRRGIVRPKICGARRIHAHSRDIDPARKHKLEPNEGIGTGERPEQKGIADWLVIRIWVSPTEIVDSLVGPARKLAGRVGVALSVESTSFSQVGFVVWLRVAGGGEVVVWPNPGIQKDASTVLVPPSISPARAGGALVFTNIVAAAATIKEPKRIFPSFSVPVSLAGSGEQIVFPVVFWRERALIARARGETSSESWSSPSSSSSFSSRKLRSAHVGEAAHQEGTLIGGAGEGESRRGPRRRHRGRNGAHLKMAPIFTMLRRDRCASELKFSRLFVTFETAPLRRYS
jgi:hypothetical protein